MPSVQGIYHIFYARQSSKSPSPWKLLSIDKCVKLFCIYLKSLPWILWVKKFQELKNKFLINDFFPYRWLKIGWLQESQKKFIHKLKWWQEIITTLQSWGILSPLSEARRLLRWDRPPRGRSPGCRWVVRCGTSCKRSEVNRY